MIVAFSILYFTHLDLPGQDYKSEADQLLQNAKEQGKIMGAAAGFSKNGQIFWTGSVGYSNESTKEAFNSKTLARIASITKVMTAVAILQLVEKGQLSLDNKFQNLLPELFPEDIQSFTIKQMLQHSAGIDDYKNSSESENMKNYPSLTDAAKVFMERPLRFDPGSEFYYTSYGYTLLGLVIEKVSGLTYANYVKSNIWEKAQMNDTRIYQEGISGVSQLYHKNNRGKIKDEKVTNLSDRLPAGGVYSTLEDMLKFGEALLNHQLLSKESFDLMTQNSGLKKDGNGYGMGLYLYGQNPKYGSVFGHNGAQIGASTFLMLLPDVNTSIVVLSNTSGAMQTVSNITIKLFVVADKAQ